MINSDEEKNFKKSFDLLYKNILHTKLQFIIYEEYLNKYLKNSNMVDTLLIDSLKNTILIKLGRILDKDKKKESVTIFYILNAIQSNKNINKNNEKIIKYTITTKKYIEDEYKQILYKIQTTRDKTVAHLDKEYKEGYTNLKIDEALLPIEIESIINYLLEIINNLNKYLYDKENNSDSIIYKLQEEINKDD